MPWWRSHRKTLALTAGVLFIALVTAPLPWPKPVVVDELRAEVAAKPVGKWRPPPTPLGDDLARGRWKAGDSVEDVLASYQQETFVQSIQLGEFTIISEYKFADYGPIRGRYEIIAFRGRLKAAGLWREPAVPFDHSFLVHEYFNTLTEEEWASYYAKQWASCYAKYASEPGFDPTNDFLRWVTQLWARSRHGVLWLNRALFGVAGRLRVLKW